MRLLIWHTDRKRETQRNLQVELESQCGTETGKERHKEICKLSWNLNVAHKQEKRDTKKSAS